MVDKDTITLDELKQKAKEGLERCRAKRIQKQRMLHNDNMTQEEQDKCVVEVLKGYDEETKWEQRLRKIEKMKRREQKLREQKQKSDTEE